MSRGIGTNRMRRGGKWVNVSRVQAKLWFPYHREEVESPAIYFATKEEAREYTHLIMRTLVIQFDPNMEAGEKRAQLGALNPEVRRLQAAAKAWQDE